uniref:Cytochrome b5 n=1 Tax=Panagrolaimus davidi TaxID=227884 RepID=A0A914QPV7_9BILA
MAPKDLKTYSIAEVSKHNSADSLWIILNDKVYDVTKFALEHPGGEDVLYDMAGQGATESFNDVGHSVDAKEMTEEYCIGKISDDDSKNAKQPNIKMANLVAGKLGVVTGGGSGIGRAIAQMLGRHGASVLVVDIQEQHAKETAELLTKENSKGKFAAFAADVSQRDEIDNLSKYFAKDFAKQSPDFLVNSAGITRDSFLIKMNDQQYDDVLNVNLKSIYMVSIFKMMYLFFKLITF